MNFLLKILQHVSFRGKNRLVYFFDKPGRGGIERVIKYKELLFNITTNHHMEWGMFWNGGYEKEVIWILDYILNKDSVCLDLGANIGIYTLPMARLSKQVYAIEPHPGFAKRLRNNFALNRLRNIEVNELAIYNEKKKMILFSPGAKMFNKSASLYECNPELTEKIEVQTTTLDEYCVSKNLNRLDFIKIDTDGSDFHVVLSGKNTIKKHRPHILFEYSDPTPEFIARGKENKENFNEVYKEMEVFLECLDYSLYEVKDGYLVYFKAGKTMANVLAVPNLLEIP